MVQCFNRLSNGRNALILLLLVSLPGCDSGPEMAPVTGVVELGGKPLPGGRIIFEPVGGGPQSKSAVGDILEDGSFELFTFEEGDGAIEGEYYPVIMDPKEDDEAATSKRKKLGILQLEDMRFEVKADHPNDFKIQLSRRDLKYRVKDD